MPSRVNVFFFLLLDERNNRVLFLSSKNKKKTLMNPWFHTYTEHGNEAANCECMPTTVDTLGEIERDQIEYFCLLFLNDVLSSSLYMLIQLFSLISVNSGF